MNKAEYKSSRDGVQFRTVVKGHNFMTPNFERYVRAGKYVCEITSGNGFDGDPIFGVTVVNTDTQTHNTKLSKMVSSMQGAEDYIKGLGA